MCGLAYLIVGVPEFIVKNFATRCDWVTDLSQSVTLTVGVVGQSELYTLCPK